MVYSYPTKNTATYASPTKHAAPDDLLLQEDGFFLLLETGDDIIIRTYTSGNYGYPSIHTSTYGSPTKH